jgi:predicted transcriptional regulator
VTKARLSKTEARILEQFWRLGTASVREILDGLPEDEQVAYTTVQTLVYRLEEKGAVRKVKKIGNAQLFAPALSQSEFRSGRCETSWTCSAGRRASSSRASWKRGR